MKANKKEIEPYNRKSGIYGINCQHCNMIYIGHIKIIIEIKLEYLRYIGKVGIQMG